MLKKNNNNKKREPEVLNICYLLEGYRTLVSLFNYFCQFAARLTGLKFSVKIYGAFKDSAKLACLPRGVGSLRSLFILARDGTAHCACSFSIIL